MSLFPSSFQFHNVCLHSSLTDCLHVCTYNNVRCFNYAEFDKLFKSIAIDNQLSKNQFLAFFEGAGLFPTQNEVNRAFGAAFTGNNEPKSMFIDSI